MKHSPEILLIALFYAALIVCECSPKSISHPSTSTISANQNPTPATPKIGEVEIVAKLDITPGNVAASKDGRMFASVHGMRRGPAPAIVVVDINQKMARARIPISLLADGETLYYGAMNGKTLYSDPARLFREGASPVKTKGC